MVRRYPMHWMGLCLALLLVLKAWVVGPVGMCMGAENEPGAAPTEKAAFQPTDEGAMDCRELAILIARQEGQISREIGQLKREIAALRDDMSKPGMREIFAGIGYIFGLAGIGLYFHARRSPSGQANREPRSH